MLKQHEWILDLGKISSTPERGVGDGSSSKRPSPSEQPAVKRQSSQLSPVKVLCSLPFLKGVHEVQIRKILKLCQVGSYKSGEEICAVNTPSDEMYILISGELAVVTGDGSQALTIDPVTTVGELGFMTGCARPVGLEAVKASKVLRVSRAQFEQLLRSDPDFQSKVHRNIIEILSDKLLGLRTLVEGALADCSKSD